MGVQTPPPPTPSGMDRRIDGSSRKPLLVGAAYEFQVLASAPHDSRDRRVDAIVTEAAVRWVAGTER